jgi:hypothetical protein
MATMTTWTALLVCSDGACAAVFEARGPLEELDALACGCGAGLQVLGWPEPSDEPEQSLVVVAVGV